jgi:4,5-dihydroxyphthalate decarboxylase
VRAYSVTTGIWTRGILQNEYGVDLSRVTWVVDDEEHVKSLKLPPNVVHAPAGRSLVDMMAAGELQAAFTDNAGIGRAGAPKEGWQASGQRPPNYVELFPDAPRLEAEWFRKTGIYPVHGLIVVKDELLARQPWVAKALFDVRRIQSATGRNSNRRTGRTRTISTGDGRHRRRPLPYGVKANRPQSTRSSPIVTSRGC